jgi:hemoglobin
MNRPPFILSAFLTAAALLLAACGSNPQAQDKNFYTSGNRAADQRADQRMAQQEQLTGGHNNGGQTTASDNAVVAMDKKTLYQRLGGADGVSAIVDDFVTRMLADPRVNFRRTGVERGGLSIHHNQSMTWTGSPDQIKILKVHLAQFIAVATGGPAQYAGKDMRTAHQNMHITNPEFDAAVGDLKVTLDKLQIANQEQKEFLAVIETTREQIVEER